ncbi:MAG: WXG100 family type VII secretion target [Candidatus Helarchaeota archaeon]
MTTIVIKPDEVRARASELKKHANNILAAVNTVDNEVKTLGPEVYDGVSAERFRTSYNRIRTKLQSFDDLLEAFASKLIQIANDMEQADKLRG